MKPTLVKIRNTYIALSSISLLSIKESDNGEANLIIDLNYSKAEDPVFLTFRFDNKGAAEEVLKSLLSHTEIHELI
jgi:hypothetical protein